MIWLVINWETKECWIYAIPNSAQNERVLFDKIYFGNKYIELRSNESNYSIKIPTQQCVIEEENIGRKLRDYYEYE